MTIPHNGTATSIAAAESVRPHVSAIRQRVLDYIEGNGFNGCTCDEVEQALGLSHQCCSARITDLHAPRIGKPRLVDSQRTRRTRSGRQATVWISCRESHQLTLGDIL
jgi:hypothetical protein